MKLKAAISEGASAELVEAFGSAKFAERFLNEVVGDAFGAVNPTKRPAEYYVQKPDTTIQTTEIVIGIEVRLTGVSRSNRPASVFHKALAALDNLVVETAIEALGLQTGQVFVIMMLDGEIETAPGSGIYSSVLEGEPKGVSSTGVHTKPGATT